MKKLAFRAFEYILSFNTDTVAACSIREARLSGWNSNQSAAVFVPNVPPLTSLHRAEPKGKSGTLRIVGAGRLGPQKDPDFFISTIQALRKAGHTFEAIWIGGGDPNLTAKLADQNIKVTGWLSRHEAIVQLRSADVYIHTAAWEGFPITLIEAVSLNVPVIARAIPALEGVMLPALIDRSSEILNFWEMMISRESREELLRSCRVGLKDYVDSQQRQGLESAYQGRAQRINGLAEKIQA
jgi:glycosyltransferase involved in cell wall biosynthesis